MSVTVALAMVNIIGIAIVLISIYFLLYGLISIGKEIKKMQELTDEEMTEKKKKKLTWRNWSEMSCSHKWDTLRENLREFYKDSQETSDEKSDD